MDQINKGSGASVRGVPDDIAAKLREMSDLNDQILAGTRGLYVPILKTLDRSGITVEKDIAYGPDDRHKLDVHTMGNPKTPVPVVVFFHGGGLIAGNKNDVGEYVYGNVLDFFARHGMVGVNATYRLAPAHKWPAGAEDVGAAVSWVHKNIAKWGGDPNRIFVAGHSAGATHVAQFALHKDLPAAPREGVAGIVLTSGGYAVNSKAPNAIAYYGEDASKHAARGTPGNVVWGDFDIFISTAEYEPFPFNRGMAALVEELTAKGGRMPRVKYLLQHNHFSQTLSFGTGDPTLADEVLDFVLNAKKQKKAA
jgi:acetyl esterase/lipase